MMEERQRKPGSVRLTEEQYAEMESLGMDNESAYVKYKLNGAQHRLQVLRNDQQPLAGVDQLPSVSKQINEQGLVDKLALQRFTIENEQLKAKLAELSVSKDEVLDGVHNQVSNMLRDELLKRDMESLKKEVQQKEKEIEQLQNTLEKTEQEVEDKDSEIEELVKKIGLVELGKALLPGAVNGLAKRFPKEMQGLASTLGELSGGDADKLQVAASLSEEQQNLLNISEYFRELFDDEQFEQLVQMVSQLGEQIKVDKTVINKVVYYLNQLARIRSAKPKQENKDEPTPTE